MCVTVWRVLQCTTTCNLGHVVIGKTYDYIAVIRTSKKSTKWEPKNKTSQETTTAGNNESKTPEFCSMRQLQWATRQIAMSTEQMSRWIAQNLLKCYTSGLAIAAKSAFLHNTNNLAILKCVPHNLKTVCLAILYLATSKSKAPIHPIGSGLTIVDSWSLVVMYFAFFAFSLHCMHSRFLQIKPPSISISIASTLFSIWRV